MRPAPIRLDQIGSRSAQESSRWYQDSLKIPVHNRGMPLDGLHPETLELLAWIGDRDPTYGETIEVWRTSCPRHSLWEDALLAGLVRVDRDGRASRVRLTAAG